MEVWAIRAQNPDHWYEKIIDLSRKGPEALLPHERGQVAHLVSTIEGVKKFAASTNPPPADWLCVFDRLIRYAKPSYLWDTSGAINSTFDPFTAFGLDSDIVPSKVDPDEYFRTREVPQDAWYGLAVIPVDRKDLDVHNFPELRGFGAMHIPKLPDRLSHLGRWLCKVSDQPAAVWWASGQSALHPHLKSEIELELARGTGRHSPTIRRAWHYIFDAWKNKTNVSGLHYFQFESSVKLDGWTNAAVRQLAQMLRPQLTQRDRGTSLGRPKSQARSKFATSLTWMWSIPAKVTVSKFRMSIS